ncbi:MAG: Mut7-C ubiquitin/RNAse domain-containing protein [Candidatus Thiodiazotropha sp. (ex Myrtea spinifera)]|nr:Mut7-C ubiquitin/RNAse domain-containing protein [Candidatus Thiodiazotropha sp. (ex Myrtea spinifera)]
MTCISLRFYEELNDFLPSDLRKRAFEHSIKPTQSIKHLIENLGVPHTEIELILANGESVGFDYLPNAGDQISLYPVFESLDVTPLLRLRDKPLRQPCFLADAHLGKLARYLRLLGFDTLFFNDAGDSRLAEISVKDRRILLTRDRGLLMRREITHGCFIHALDTKEQLTELFKRLDLYRLVAPFTRCMMCNGSLNRIEKATISTELPKRVGEIYTEFWRCSDCAKIYWKGSHYRQLMEFIKTIAPAAFDE